MLASLVTTNHPITDRLHERYKVSKAKPRSNDQNVEFSRAGFSQLAQAMTSSMSKPVIVNTDYANDLSSKLNLLGSKMQEVLIHAINKFSQHYQYEFLENSKLAVMNVIALFTGLFAVMHELININKNNFDVVCKSIKAFMKDVAHMQLGLYFVLLKAMGIEDLPSCFYQIKNPKENFTYDNRRLDFSQGFEDSLNSYITYNQIAKQFQATFKIYFNDTKIDQHFFSCVPAKSCPALYEPVIIDGEQKSLVDATLDWIQRVIEQNILPSLAA